MASYRTEIRIPTAADLLHRNRSEIEVTLPLSARPHRMRNFIHGVIWLLIGLPSVAGTMIIAALLIGRYASLSTADFCILIACLLLFLPVSLILTGVIITCFSDAAIKSPVLILDQDGFRDFRSKTSLPWTAITKASLIRTHKGIARVELELKQSVTARQNPFRIGILRFNIRRNPKLLSVQTCLLQPRDHICAHTILALVQCYGGVAELKRGRKIIPLPALDTETQA